MQRYPYRFLILCVLLLALSLAGYLVGQHEDSEAETLDWSQLPRAVAGWQGREQPEDPAVAEYLQADAMKSRIYHKEGLTVFFTAIFGTQWRSLHSPAGCFPSQGWLTVDRHATTIEAPPGASHPGPLHAEQLFVKQGNKHLLVTYLYAHPGGTTASWIEQCLKVAKSGMRKGGIVVILEGKCTPDSRDAMDQAQRELLQALYPEVVRVWDAKL